MWLIFLTDLATLLCGLEGILIAGVQITPALLKLKVYLNMDKATLDTLFNFKDHQNVPKTIELLSALYKLSKLPKFVDEGTNQSLVLLGQFIGFVITPYTDSSMCLTDQLVSLSAAGHLPHNHTSFCPGQFYYDAQSFIKATFWYVAKQKVLNPAGSFYIIQTPTVSLCKPGSRGSLNLC